MFLNTLCICANFVKNQKRSRYFLVDLAWNDPIETWLHNVVIWYH